MAGVGRTHRMPVLPLARVYFQMRFQFAVCHQKCGAVANNYSNGNLFFSPKSHVLELRVTMWAQSVCKWPDRDAEKYANNGQSINYRGKSDPHLIGI